MEEKTVDNHIDGIIRDNTLYRFACELQNTTDEGRKEHIKQIINQLEGVNEMTYEDKIKNKKKNLFEQIDKFTLHSNWTKLTQVQQRERVSSYLKTASKDKKKIESVLKLFDDGKIKKSSILYDKEKGHITEIKNITLKLSSDSSSDSLSNSDSNSGSDSSVN